MKIAIITGGESGERDISIKSAENIKNLLDFAKTETFIFPEDKPIFLNKAQNFDIVIPIIHGIGGEDGEVQRLCQTRNLPFLFSSPEVHALTIDKLETKKIVEALGITCPKLITTYPLFAKPRFGGSSLATKVCNSEKELTDLKNTYPTTEFITEELVKGKEYTVGVIEVEAEHRPLPVIEIIPQGDFFDFENKYIPEKMAAEICPAQISDSLASKLQQLALTIHTKLGVRHISRSDFIITPDNNIYFLEINTIPGMTAVSLLPKMLTTANLSLKEIIREWCENLV